MATKLRIWNRQEFDNQDSKLLLHQHEIQTSENITEDRHLRNDECSELQILWSKQWDVSKCVRSIWRKKSWQTSCKLGDKNTKFLHMTTSTRRGINFINQIKYNDKLHTSPIDIKEAVTFYFSSLFTNDTTRRATVGPLGFTKLSTQRVQVHLLQDNMTYDRAWHFWYGTWIFRLRKLPKRVNVSHVVLVPKTKLPIKFSKYRSISSMYGLYKTVGKLLSNRLRQVMSSIISANQTTFIFDRQILDGFIIANTSSTYFRNMAIHKLSHQHRLCN